MSTTVILASPGPLDLRALANATRLSVALLKPWAVQNIQSESRLVGEVTKQAARYVDAIALTVSATYSGYTVTTDVLCLAGMLGNSKVNKKKVDHYVTGLLTLARESKAKATKALDSLRDIRIELMELRREFLPRLESYNTKFKQNGDRPEVVRLLSGLDGDLETLKTLSDQVSLFISWWDWAQIDNTCPSCEEQPIEFQLDALRDSGTVAMWEEMKVKYMSWARVISDMQDADPEFFSRSSPRVSGITTKPVKSKKGTDWQEIGIQGGALLLSLVHEAARFTPVPYLAQAAGTTLQIVRTVQAVKENKAAFMRLAEQASGIITAIYDSYMRSPTKQDWPPRELLSVIQDLISTLRDILKFAQEQVSRNRAIRVLFSMADVGKLQEYTRRLDGAVQKFEVSSHLHINDSLNQVLNHQIELQRQLVASGMSSSSTHLLTLPAKTEDHNFGDKKG